MALEPEDLTTLKQLFDEKLKVFGHALDQRDTALLDQVDLRIQARFQRELAEARAALRSSNGAAAHAGPSDVDPPDHNGRVPSLPGPSPSPQPQPQSKASAIASTFLDAVAADPVGAIGTILRESLQTFIQFRQVMAPHPYDQALKLMQDYPQVTALWAPNPLGPWQQQVLAQSMLIGANAARQMKGEMLFPGGPPSPGNAIPLPGPSAVLPSPSSGPLPSSSAVPSVPPGMPSGPPVQMAFAVHTGLFE